MLATCKCKHGQASSAVSPCSYCKSSDVVVKQTGQTRNKARTDLVHTGVHEQQAGVSSGSDRGGRDEAMFVFQAEEVQESAADSGSG